MKEKNISEMKDVSKNNAENKAEVKVKEKKSNKRMILVIIFLITVLCAGGIVLRGSYLEKME